MSPGLRRFTKVGSVIVLLLAVAGAVTYGVVRHRRANPAAQYRTEPVTRGTVTASVTATGTISAVTTVQVGSQVSGIISRLHADFNSNVKKGELLVELDPTPFEAQVAQRRADLTRAEVEARNAEVTFRRMQRLSQQGLVADAELDAARAGFEANRAQVDQSRAALSQAETNLRYTRIVSPIDGVVVDRQYDVGQTVAASFQAPTLFTIAQDMTKMQVQADVDQSDIGRIEVGQRARFTVDAYPEEEFRGSIAQIRLNATVNQTVITYPVIIEVANPDEKLRPKMTANVTIEVARVRDALRVPNAALRFRPEGVATPSPSPASSGGGPIAERRSQGRRGQAEAATGEASGASGATGPRPGGRGGDGADAASGDRGPGDGRSAEEGGRRGGARRSSKPTVWVLTAEGTLRPVQVQTGLTDGRFTEVSSEELHEGDLVVVGLATAKGAENAQRPPGLGGGGRGGRF